MEITKNEAYKKVFDYFYELTQIPRPSHQEKEVSDYLVKFAKDHIFEYIQDEHLNVIIKKPASKGYENSKTVIIQGHMDMVAEKEASSSHDFTKDPLKLRVDGDNLYATDTTLGADNGIAVAMGLALLDDKEAQHPPIELLITTSEETGMFGAIGLDGKNLSGKYMLNIDSEEEGIFTVSCAGGNVTYVSFAPEYKENDKKGHKLTVKGFRGGHSGQVIHEQRGNAIKILGRVLDKIDEISAVTLSKVTGGAKHNAIAREAVAEFIIEDESKLTEIIEAVKQFQKVIESEYKEESGIAFILEDSDIKKVMDEESSENIIDYIIAVPDGVQTMIRDMGVVESSLNVGVLEFMEDSKIRFTHAIRSSVKSKKEEITNRVLTLAYILNAEAEVSGDYPAWQYEPQSKLKDISIETYKAMYGKEPEIEAIHAGLECGILKEKLPETEMISFGPNMWDVHTPKEHLSISSTERVYDYTKELLKNLK